MRNRLLHLAVLAIPMLCQAQSEPCAGQQPVDLGPVSAHAMVVGEMHGTVEFPNLVKRLACQLARSGKPVILGLEIDGSEQARLSAYLASSGSAADQAALMQSDFWTAPFQDGRRSQAMFSLIDHARRMRETGAAILIDAMDAPGFPARLSPQESFPDGYRDAFMALHVESRLSQYPDAAYVALMGNVHASKRKPPSGDRPEPMTYRLNLHTPIAAITGSWTGGSIWACWGPNVADCKIKSVSAARPRDDYDLSVPLGSLTASPPQSR
jgi:hypothetical protein